MTDILEQLAAKVEALDGPTYEIFEEVFFACNPGPSVFGCSSYHNEAIEAHSTAIKRFKQLVDVEAWLDAAMTLLPEGWRVCNFSQHDHPLLRERGEWLCSLYPDGKVDEANRNFYWPRCHHAKHPALALVAAALRAKEATNG